MLDQIVEKDYYLMKFQKKIDARSRRMKFSFALFSLHRWMVFEDFIVRILTAERKLNPCKFNIVDSENQKALQEHTVCN